METHGSESYYVLDEGLLDVSVGGRERTLSDATEAATPPFRFRRIGPRGRAPGAEQRRKLANAMVAGGGGESDIPAGYTYLGQFVDHDLTFDKTKVTFGQTIAPAKLLQARSPSLDLDSLYGAGPQDPDSAKFYKDDRHLKMGKTVALDPDPAHDGFDLPRGAGSTKKEKQKAVIPDPRNDENLAVAQTHLAFIRFHNRIVDTLPPEVPAPQRFAKARELAIKHYQWMLRHDFLPRIVKPSIVDEVFSDGRKLVEIHATPTDVPAMPIEFSVAAYRLGHAMIREDYNWNKRFPGQSGALFFLFDFSGTSGTLAGFPRLPSNWIADWRRLYDFKGEAGKNNLAAPGGLNRAMRIDTRLTNFLKFLPKGSFGGKQAEEGTIVANLAFRNLTRAGMVKLASGQQMAEHARKRGVPVKTLTKAQLRNGDGGAKLDRLTTAQRDRLLANTPLWFYILREAELNDGKLRGVGGRLVAETFHRAMEGSEHSIVRDPAFRPSLGPDNSTFRMVDLLLFAFEGKKALLAPLG